MAFLAHTLKGVKQSAIRLMTRECQRVGGINLAQGLCDLPVPPFVLAGAEQAMRQGHNIYTVPEGCRELRETIAQKLARDNGLNVDPLSEIVVTVGVTGAYSSTLKALLNPGDGVLVMEPYYGYHVHIAKVAGLQTYTLTLTAPDFRLDEQALREALNPAIRAVVVCTPGNPSGKVFDRAELEIIARVAHEHDLLVITDEIYEYFTYDGLHHLSPATVGDLYPRTVSMMGFSKVFSITGWRLGYVVAPEPLAHAVMLANDSTCICAPAPLQYGVIAGLNAAPEFFTQRRADFQRKREMLHAAVTAAGMRADKPRGSYYILADISALGYPSAWDAAMDLLENKGVATVPGTAFFHGPEGENYLRICFAKEDEVLAQACERLSSF
ncbi:MAG: pyridoxal phosphate-dependent aminotransferase [Candidatus Competibacteraceae bacterium]|nr:pyridoxal phosphate-dependent aminotransferase [Candidatus Competibacteraceae bacterium]